MLTHYADWVARLSDQHYLGYLLVLCIVILGLLAAGIFFVRRAYWISNTATSRIASAHQGYIEIEGTAKAEAGVFPLRSPLSGTPCVWYEVFVEQDRPSEGWMGDGWGMPSKPSRIFHQKSDHLIVVDDGTGECVVDPDGAAVYPAHTRRWRGETEMPSHASVIRASRHFGPYQYTEKLIQDRDPVYVLGWFKTIRHDPQIAVEDAVKSLLRTWKQDPAKMRSFDQDGNGIVDEAEWRVARRAAQDTVYRQQLTSFDEAQAHIHMMGGLPGNQRPFIISALDQVSLARRYRRWGYAFWLVSILGFYFWVTAFYMRG